MASTESLIDSSDFAGVTLTHTPTSYKAGLNNVSAVFGSGTGGLTAYRATVKYPTGTQTKTGALANGETINFNFTTAPTSITDKVFITMEYMKSGDSAYRQFNYSYSIMNTSQFGTIMSGMQGKYGLGLFERVFIATILILMLGGVTTYYAGVMPGAIVGLFVMGYLSYAGFISKWLVVIPIFAGAIILAQRSQAQ
jgi:hypothetical protein